MLQLLAQPFYTAHPPRYGDYWHATRVFPIAKVMHDIQATDGRHVHVEQYQFIVICWAQASQSATFLGNGLCISH
jgi:hypothetical protein